MTDDRRHSVAYAASIERSWPKYWVPERAFEISKGAAILSKCYEEGISDHERQLRLIYAAYMTLLGYGT